MRTIRSIAFCSIVLTITCATFNFKGAMENRKVEVASFSEDVLRFRRIFGKFISQDWIILALQNKCSGSVVRETSKFINSDVKCIKFYHHDDLVGNYGSCIGLPKANSKGWVKYGQYLILKDSFDGDISSEFYFYNPRDFGIGISGKFEMPLKQDHFLSAINESFFAVLFALLIILCVGWFIRVLEKEERTEDFGHDVKAVADDDMNFATYVLISNDHEEIKKLAYEKKCQALLKKEVLDPNRNDVVCRDFFLPDLIEVFCKGFFHGKDLDFECSETPAVWVKTDKSQFFVVLLNLFKNASEYVASRKNRIISLKILDKGKNLTFIISNDGSIKNPKSIFKRGFSLEGGTGRGLHIVEKSLASLGSPIDLLCTSDRISFSFSIPKSLEKSCPVLFI